MSERLRLDKWLWQARFFKTRALALRAIGAGGLRLNGRPVVKGQQMVSAGDVLTLPLGPKVVAVRIAALGSRRGPAAEACKLYEDVAATIPPKLEG